MREGVEMNYCGSNVYGDSLCLMSMLHLKIGVMLHLKIGVMVKNIVLPLYVSSFNVSIQLVYLGLPKPPGLLPRPTGP